MSDRAIADPQAEEIIKERQRRYNLWSELLSRWPGGIDAPPSGVRELHIYGGMGQGIFVDKQRTTGAIAEKGIAVGLNWANGYPEDGLDGDDFIYSYPSTNRSGQSDANEIQAVKNAKTLDLPLFFIDAVTRPLVRNVRLAWVADWDDSQMAFHLVFSKPDYDCTAAASTKPFVLDKVRDDRGTTRSKSRPGQRFFKYRVLRRYGSQCALCSLSVPALLDAAHLKPSSLKGTDDERNGLVLCKLHHAALDERLIAINPETLHVEPRKPLYSLTQLKIEYTSIEHLASKPAREALDWLFNHRNVLLSEPS
jgi:putative restriction endonuclease